jgi:hypothetical protein
MLSINFRTIDDVHDCESYKTTANYVSINGASDEIKIGPLPAYYSKALRLESDAFV